MSKPKRQLLSLTVLAGFLCGPGPALAALAAEPRAPQPLASADATTIVLGEIQELDPAGHRPSFSPDGTNILFDKAEPLLSAGKRTGQSTTSIWVMSPDGTKQRRLLSGGMNAAWSTDGKRIGFQPVGSLVQVLGGSANIAIFDMTSERTFSLGTVSWSSFEEPHIRWARDGRRIFFGVFSDLRGDWGFDGHAIDLDSLSVQSAYQVAGYPESTPWTGASSEPAEEHERGYRTLVEAWECEHLATICHPRVRLLTRSWLFGGGPGNLWISNRDGSFERMLSGSTWDRVSLSPDLSMVVLGSADEKGGIFIARLKTTEPAVRRFAVPIGRALLTQNGMEAWGYTPCLERPIMAAVYGPKINPLNGKTIGPNGELRGYVKLVGLRPDRSEITVWWEQSQIRPGDVITEINTFNDRPGEGGCSARDFWAVIEPM